MAHKWLESGAALRLRKVCENLDIKRLNERYIKDSLFTSGAGRLSDTFNSPLLLMANLYEETEDIVRRLAHSPLAALNAIANRKERTVKEWTEDTTLEAELFPTELLNDESDDLTQG